MREQKMCYISNQPPGTYFLVILINKKATYQLTSPYSSIVDRKDDYSFSYLYIPIHTNIRIHIRPKYDVYIPIGIITGKLLKIVKISRLDGAKNEGLKYMEAKVPLHLSAGFFARYKMNTNWGLIAGAQIRCRVRNEFPIVRYCNAIPEDFLFLGFHAGVYYSFGRSK
ncbi:MAG: hypothetical protein KKA07_10605 [Bacteroidetes bacterium]|nr:hypothetical protein [Bacteroidota bacterium]MBU1719507.1 hypothetical protein [Bacteroidota bacterium]